MYVLLTSLYIYSYVCVDQVATALQVLGLNTARATAPGTWPLLLILHLPLLQATEVALLLLTYQNPSFYAHL